MYIDNSAAMQAIQMDVIYSDGGTAAALADAHLPTLLVAAIMQDDMYMRYHDDDGLVVSRIDAWNKEIVAAVMSGPRAKADMSSEPADQVFSDWVQTEQHATIQVQLLAADIQTGQRHVPFCTYVLIDGVQELVSVVDATLHQHGTKKANGWHVPKNERDCDRSPQRALWRTAKELKHGRGHGSQTIQTCIL
jgi:hypothetical protein